MKPLASVDDLSFFLKRFAPRIHLQVAPDAVVAAASEGEVRVPATISFLREGRGRIVGIGDDRIDDADAVTVQLFSPAGVAAPEYDDLVNKFLAIVLQRVLGKITRRPVVILEGLNSLPREISARVREALLRGLPRAGAAAIVVDPTQ